MCRNDFIEYLPIVNIYLKSIDTESCSDVGIDICMIPNVYFVNGI